jgi:uncharacterized protein
MPNVVFDASSIVGALLKHNSVPERAFLLACTHDALCLSPDVEGEIREVLGRRKFQRYVTVDRRTQFLGLLSASATLVEPKQRISDCRDAKDNKYLELALAAGVDVIVASDEDLLVLDPWRGIRIMRPADYVRRIEARLAGAS